MLNKQPKQNDYSTKTGYTLDDCVKYLEKQHNFITWSQVCKGLLTLILVILGAFAGWMMWSMAYDIGYSDALVKDFSGDEIYGNTIQNGNVIISRRCSWQDNEVVCN